MLDRLITTLGSVDAWREGHGPPVHGSDIATTAAEGIGREFATVGIGISLSRARTPSTSLSSSMGTPLSRGASCVLPVRDVSGMILQGGSA